MSNGNGHRWSKFWWQDWQNDAALKRCSLAARGLWMEMLCIAHAGEPCGYLRLNGQALTVTDLNDMIAKTTEKEVERLLAELEGRGVFSRADDGAIYSRRMVKDAEASEAGREHVSKRWNGGNPPPPPNRGANREPDSQPNGKAREDAYREPIPQKLEADSEARSRERKEEKKERPLATLAPSAGAEDARDFEAFWQVYPRKVGRGAAARSFAAACRKAPAEVIIAAVQRAVWSADPRFIPHPTTWLHGERWTDEVEHPDAALLRAVGLSPGGLLQ